MALIDVDRKGLVALIQTFGSPHDELAFAISFDASLGGFNNGWHWFEEELQKLPTDVLVAVYQWLRADYPGERT